MKDIKGENALLTGGSRGLGPYIGRALAREGVNVALAARTEKALTSVAEELTGLGVHAMAVACDITDGASRKSLLDQVKARFGQIDILINNAGIMTWILRNFGVYDFYRRQSEDNEKAFREEGVRQA
ncbi:MAG: SDR family NAD(P)-dependent oxidoreductase [Deltaproteobacteria bacterium]|nr:SDR family NAD(P)-dependent oxidoreductase [Deltaproteobacteria bacterium]